MIRQPASGSRPAASHSSVRQRSLRRGLPEIGDGLPRIIAADRQQRRGGSPGRLGGLLRQPELDVTYRRAFNRLQTVCQPRQPLRWQRLRRLRLAAAAAADRSRRLPAGECCILHRQRQSDGRQPTISQLACPRLPAGGCVGKGRAMRAALGLQVHTHGGTACVCDDRGQPGSSFVAPSTDGSGDTKTTAIKHDIVSSTSASAAAMSSGRHLAYGTDCLS